MTPTRRQFLQQLGFTAAGLGLIGYLPGCASTTGSVAVRGLPRSRPEEQGVDSQGILDFLAALQQSTHEFHSLMIMRHGHVVAEGWWAPYGPEFNHTMYSMSKSFTSTAVGFAVAEGRLKVTDPVVSFFPTELPENPSDNLKKLRVKDLLTMSVGSVRDTTAAITATENWVRTFLSLPIVNPPGSTFLYNSGATYMLSAIVQQLTGQRVLDYLKPRLFEPLGISGMTWETCPCGINTGGWGLSIKTEGLARFGQTYLQKGVWNGRQVIPAAWVEEATTFKIQQPKPANARAGNERNDWLQGYCYQFWRCQNNAFRGDGAFGQYTIVMPEQDAVIAITGESSNMQGELDLVWKHLLPAMKDKPLPPTAHAQRVRLLSTLEGLALSPVANVSPPIIDVVKLNFKMETNSLGIESASIISLNSGYRFAVHDAQGEHVLICGMGSWRRGETSMPGTPPRLLAGGAPVKGTRSKVAASCGWTDPKNFTMLWRYYETPHHDAVQCKLDGDRIEITFQSSIAKLRSAKDSRPTLTGKLSA